MPERKVISAVDILKTAPSVLLSWWDTDHADLPWRRTKDPYAIWVSEIMLQQTQISTVIPYYERWLVRLPTVQALADASLDEVLKLWEGLGYYSRVRHLHAAASQVMEEFNGRIPRTVPQLLTLKGIGRYTAGAIASIAFNQPAPVLDGNVIRVFSRLIDLPDDITMTATKNQLWQLAETVVPSERPGDYNQALMELGQQVCLPKNPLCQLCPLSSKCQARQYGTQNERPVRPPRKNTPHYDVVAGIIWERGIPLPSTDARFLIAKRPLNGLLGGLWEFPGGKQEDGESLTEAVIREIDEELKMEIEVGELQTVVKHAYTHFRITLHAFHAIHIQGNPQHIGVDDHAWVSLTDLDNYAFAVTDQKIIASLRQTLIRENLSP
jgi:A/G-specific adenine glycosylase